MHGNGHEVVGAITRETGDDAATRIDAAFSTAVLLKNRGWMFQILRTGVGSHYLSVVAGGVALYGVTIRLLEEDAAALVAVGEQAEAFAQSVIRDPGAFEDRRVRASIDP